MPRNQPWAVAALLALLAGRRHIVMVYAFQSPSKIASDLRQFAPAAFVCGEADLAPEIAEAAGECGAAVVALSGTSAKLIERPSQNDRTARDEAAVIEIHTSGTTGRPKRFTLSYGTIERYHLGNARGDGEGAPPSLLFFPMGNISGIYSTLPAILLGARAVLLERFTLEAWLDYVRRYRPDRSGIPPSYLGLLLDMDVPREDLASLKLLGLGAAPVDPTAQRAFEDRYGIPIQQSYGATEFAGPVTIMSPDLIAQWGRAKLGSVGRPLPGAKVRVVDPCTSEALPPDQAGILEVVSPRIGTEWIRTSDIGRIDADGFLFLEGRADFAIMRGGFKVLPDEIERVLLEHPAVLEAAVSGVRHARLGEVPAAAVRLKPGADDPGIAGLEAHLRERLPAPQIPAKWIFPDALPRNASHKIDRIALRALCEE